jgi:anti-sigma-K factor RskA
MSDRNEWLLAAWLENRLTKDERREFEVLCQQDNDFAAQVELANQSIMLAQDYDAEPVPHWDREASFLAPSKQPWWQWSGFPVASMAMSVFAICLVVFNVEFRFEGNGLMISFAGQNEQQKLEQLVDARMQILEQRQAEDLDAHVEQLRKEQLVATSQLTNFVLQSSRTERKEDFAEFIRFINEQRSDDQLFYARQLNQLQQDLLAPSSREP